MSDCAEALCLFGEEIPLYKNALKKLLPQTTEETIKGNGVIFLSSSPFHAEEKQKIRHALVESNLDWAIQKIQLPPKKLLVSDMDSTLIAVETLDLMADMIGKGEEVAQITAKAMNGGMDFSQSLNLRLQCLVGVKAEPLYQQTLDIILNKINPGADQLVHSFSLIGGISYLVSGGFTFAAKAVAEKLGFDGYYANELEIDHKGNLNGKVKGVMVDRAFKANILTQQAKRIGITLEQTIAIGDGANDLDMLSIAGLGIGYQAKKIVRETINAQINSGNLASVLKFI